MEQKRKITVDELDHAESLVRHLCLYINNAGHGVHIHHDTIMDGLMLSMKWYEKNFDSEDYSMDVLVDFTYDDGRGVETHVIHERIMEYGADKEFILLGMMTEAEAVNFDREKYLKDAMAVLDAFDEQYKRVWDAAQSIALQVEYWMQAKNSTHLYLSLEKEKKIDIILELAIPFWIAKNTHEQNFLQVNKQWVAETIAYILEKPIISVLKQN